jgi:hypothetical protein
MSTSSIWPALGVARAGDVGVREFVDDGDLGLAREDRVDVHLAELVAPVVHDPAGYRGQATEQFGRLLPAVRLDEPDHHVRAALGPPAGLAEHRERLADARRGTEIDPQFAAAGPVRMRTGPAAGQVGVHLFSLRQIVLGHPFRH